MYGIEEARAEVLTAVAGLTDEQLNEEVESGRWTIAQVLEHLYLIESVVAARIEKMLADEKNGPADKQKPIQRTLDRSHKAEAPAILEPSQGFQSGDVITGKLAESREKLLAIIDSAGDESVLSGKSAQHPVFGTMNLQQWIEFIGLHERRHLQQIEELKAKL